MVGFLLPRLGSLLGKLRLKPTHISVVGIVTFSVKKIPWNQPWAKMAVERRPVRHEFLVILLFYFSLGCQLYNNNNN